MKKKLEKFKKQAENIEQIYKLAQEPIMVNYTFRKCI